MSHLLEKLASPEVNPIASSTPNLMAGLDAAPGSPSSVVSATHSLGPQSSSIRTLPRPHCYTNAAPSKVEGNVFRYDFIENTNVPPVNRKLKPKLSIEADKPPEELAAKPPQLTNQMDSLVNRLQSAQIHSSASLHGNEKKPLKPPSVDRKNKPNAYKVINNKLYCLFKY